MKTTGMVKQVAAGVGIFVAVVAGAISVVGVANGCATGEDLGDPPDTGLDLATDGVIQDGFSWCIRAHNAVIEIPGQPDPEVDDPDDNNNFPKGCMCASPDEHASLDTLDMNNDWFVTVDAAQPKDLRAFRNNVIDAAEKHCNEVAAEQAPLYPNNTCDEEVDANDLLFLEQIPPGQFNCNTATERIGTAPGMEDPPGDHYYNYYSLSSVITYNSGTQTYQVDDAFFYDMLDNPAWFLDDSARIVPTTGSPPYKFVSVGTSTIAYKLGIRTNDRPVSVNGLPLSGGMLDALHAFETLENATFFNFVVKRGTNNVLLKIQVI